MQFDAKCEVYHQENLHPNTLDCNTTHVIDVCVVIAIASLNWMQEESGAALIDSQRHDKRTLMCCDFKKTHGFKVFEKRDISVCAYCSTKLQLGRAAVLYKAQITDIY